MTSWSKFTNGTVADADEVNENYRFLLNNLLNFCIDGVTSTSQENVHLKSDATSSVSQKFVRFMEDSGSQWQTLDMTGIPTYGGSDYYIDIYSTGSVSTGNLSVNNCQALLISRDYDTGERIYRMYSTSADYEVQRAEVMKTLFAGATLDNTGSDERVTGIASLTALKSSDSRDVGKRAYFLSQYSSGVPSLTGNGADTNDLDITFASASGNANVCVWSSGLRRKSNSNPYGANNSLELPTGTVLETADYDTFGTDTSADEATNPADMLMSAIEPDTSGTTYGGSQTNGYIRTVLLTAQTISTTYTKGWESSYWSDSETDFTGTGGIPLFTAVEDLSEDTAYVIFDDTAVTLNNPNYILLQKTISVDSANTGLLEFSANGGTNYQDVTSVNEEIAAVTNTGTDNWWKFSVTRTDLTTNDSFSEYYYYYFG